MEYTMLAFNEVTRAVIVLDRALDERAADAVDAAPGTTVRLPSFVSDPRAGTAR
jgi:hypothetical protein